MANKPNNPSLWSKAKSMAKQKFDVYPSAYANGWAAKWYKSKGGTWSKAEYGMQVMDDGGVPAPVPIPYSREYMQNLQNEYDQFYAPPKQLKDDRYDRFLSYKLSQQPLVRSVSGPGWLTTYNDGFQEYTPITGTPPKDNAKRKSVRVESYDYGTTPVLGHLSSNILEILHNNSNNRYKPEYRREYFEDGGGIPERYKNMGFDRVGQKKESTSEGKKWMVLAKKGDDYKVVHGGYDGMQDYTQHGSEQRRENFWDRMGGRDSAKAQDPFSPLYWHKRFGTWGEGGEIDYMAKGGIYINPANEGKFTASAQAAGMGVQEFAKHVLANKEDYSSTQVKRANFARNAAGWKKQRGGEIDLPMAQTGWVQRAANADLNFWEKCRLASSANNGGGGGGYYTTAKEAKPVANFDYISNLDNDIWFGKDELKQVRRTRPRDVDEKVWNALNSDARWVTNDFTNKSVWDADKINPATGRLDDKYLADEWRPKLNISNRYRHYNNIFKDKTGPVTAQDLYNYYSAQPGGWEAYKTLVNNDYMPQKKDGGNFSGIAYYNHGGFIPMYNVGGMPCYECGGMYQDGGWHSEWAEDPALADEFGYEYQEPAVASQPMPTTSGPMDPWQQYWEETYGPGSVSSSAAPAPAGMTPTTTPVIRKPTYNPSIVDYLNGAGIPSDFASRKQYAQEMGITNYRGTADQNLQMLNGFIAAERGAPAPTPAPNPTDPSNTGGGGDMVYNPETGSWVPTAVVLGAVGTIGGLGMYGINKSWKDTPKAAVKSLTGLAKDDMIKAIKDRGYRLGTDYDELMKAGFKPNEIMKELKGIPFKDTLEKRRIANLPKTREQFTQKLFNDGRQQMTDVFKQASKDFKNRFKAADPIIQEINNRGVRKADDLARLRQAGLTQQEAQDVLRGLKFEKAVPAASRSFGQAVREGYAALRSAPALGRVAKAARSVGKYLPFEDGGELYMQEGGWNIGDYHVPDWLKTTAQVLDPSGISSYGDVYDAWKNPNVPAWEAGLETFAALPVIGKVGKAVKGTTKLAKIMNKVDKAAKYVSPIAYMDRKIPVNSAFANFMAARAAGKAPVTRGIMEMGSLGNQGRRFFTGAEGLVDGMDSMMGYTPKKADGGMAGDEMEVTPQELEQLKAMGYQIEIL